MDEYESRGSLISMDMLVSVCNFHLFSSNVTLGRTIILYYIVLFNLTRQNIYCHLELPLAEYQSFFWQTNNFSFATPYSVSSLWQLHLNPLAMLAIASIK